jgi:H+/gluconate symporter-like permease
MFKVGNVADEVNGVQEGDSVTDKICQVVIQLKPAHSGTQIICTLTENGGETATASHVAMAVKSTSAAPPITTPISPSEPSPGNELVTIIVVVVVACLIIGVAIFVFLRFRKNKEQSTNEGVNHMNVDVDDEEKNPLNNANNEKEAVWRSPHFNCICRMIISHIIM